MDNSKSNLSYFENKERNKIKTKIKRIEADIETYEKKVEELEEEMQRPENCTSYTKLAELQNELNEMNEKLELKMQEWENLNNSLEE